MRSLRLTATVEIFPVPRTASYKRSMAQREPQFEIIPLKKISSLVASAERISPRPRVLSISYDESLARTRELILEAAGINVHTALDLQKAMGLFEKNRYDLVILGHSIPFKERQLIAQRLRAISSTPILAISRVGEHSPVPAEHHVNAADGPRRLLTMVRGILKMAEPAAATLNEGESGDEVIVSGIYELAHVGGHVPHESVFLKGDIFPDCARCAAPVQFSLLMAAPSLEQDPDFQHVPAARRSSRVKKRKPRR